MFYQLTLGSIVISLAVVVQAGFIVAATNWLPEVTKWIAKGQRTARSGLIVILGTLWLLLAHSVAVWMWAFTFMWIEAFETFEPALYFSLVSFTTLGFGDIILPVETRLLSGLAAANGLIAFGLSTAFLVEFLLQIRKNHQRDNEATHNGPEG